MVEQRLKDSLAQKQTDGGGTRSREEGTKLSVISQRELRMHLAEDGTQSWTTSWF